jgi:ornithine cyclodeaminase/alanine dehydrogenase-like protein (mu-crystallin family)
MNHHDTKYTKILYLTGADVQAVCDEINPIAVVEEVFRTHGTGESILPSEAYLGWQNDYDESVRSLSMPSYLGGHFGVAGTKIINSNPANSVRGLPRASGLTLLFDVETARIQCVMEASYISALRTASVSMLALRLLANPNMRSLCIIGAGAVGKAHLALAVRTFPTLQCAVLFDVDPQAAKATARTLSGQAAQTIEIELAKSPKVAVHSADVVIAATTATVSYIPHDWLRPGAVAINVSLDDFLPDVFLKADLLFVDDWTLVREDSRRLLGQLYRQGRIAGPKQITAPPNARRIDGELGDLVLGRHIGRRTPEEIILVNPFGLAIEDVAFASRVFDIARNRGLGTYLSV